MSNELATVDPPINPLGLIQAAIANKIEPAQLEKLMDLQERWERNRAAEAFSVALSDFQGMCPTIFKRRTSTGGKLSFPYASYDDVMREAGPCLAECGLAVSFDTAPEPKGIKIICKIQKGIHSQTTTLVLPIPAGVVNDTQLFGQAVQYGKRYSLCAALNIVVTDEDNDAAGLDTLTAAEARTIHDLIAEKKVDVARFLAFAESPSVEEICRKNFPKILDMLKKKKVSAA